MQNVYFSIITSAWFNLLLLIYILINTLKDYVSEVVILLMIYLIEYAFPSKTEDLNWSVFNVITGINELKTLTKHISCECKYKFDGRKCNSDRKVE